MLPEAVQTALQHQDQAALQAAIAELPETEQRKVAGVLQALQAMKNEAWF